MPQMTENRPLSEGQRHLRRTGHHWPHHNVEARQLLRIIEGADTGPLQRSRAMERTISVVGADRSRSLWGSRTGRWSSRSTAATALDVGAAVHAYQEQAMMRAMRGLSAMVPGNDVGRTWAGMDYAMQEERAMASISVDTAQGRDLDNIGVLVGVARFEEETDEQLRTRMQSIQGQWASNAPVAVKVDAPSKGLLVRIAVKVTLGKGPDAPLAVEAEDLLGYTPLAERVGASSALRRALASLGIEILDQVSVDKYKACMVSHYESHQKMAMPTWRLHKLEDYAMPVPQFVLRKAVEIKKALPACRFYVDQLAVDPFLIVSMDALKDPFHNVPSRCLDDDSAYIEVWEEPKFEASL